MSSLRRVLAVTLLSLPVAIGLWLPPAAQVTRITVPRDPWAVVLGTDRPFYLVGDDARVVWRITDGTPLDAFGYAFQSGGNGCTYQVTIADAAGRTVWQPGSVTNGQFAPPACLFSLHAWNLFHGSSEGTSLSVPLVFQNAGGIGAQGLPLPPGFYQARLAVSFHGPHETPPNPQTTPGGLDFGAAVPLQIR